MTSLLFQVVFWTAAPFWAVMIFAPRWRRTGHLVASPLIAVPPLAIYLALMLPRFTRFWPVMTRPNLDALQSLLGSSGGAAAIWAHLVAFDLLLGRWMYLDGTRRRISPLLLSPILFVTIFFSATGVLAYLVVRGYLAARDTTRRSPAPSGVRPRLAAPRTPGGTHRL